MDQNTTAVVRLIEATELSGRDDLIAQAKRAFLDYLAALLAARREPAVENLRLSGGAQLHLLPRPRGLDYLLQRQ